MTAESGSLCELLSIEFPIVAFSHCRDVVAAVSRAGGLGVLGATLFTPEELEMELRWIDEHVAGKPYGVDVIVPPVPVDEHGDPPTWEALRALVPTPHRAFMEDLLERYGVPASDEALAVAARQHGITAGIYGGMALAKVAFDHPIKLIASALGTPPGELIDAAHSLGVTVGALAGKAEHALRHKEAGVDLIVAQGYEAAGHTGDIGTMVLVPEVVDAVSPTPVLAAGGIATGRQMAAAMALGAQGIWTGSVWLATSEAETLPAVREKIIAATSSDTLRTRCASGKPVRFLRSAYTNAWDARSSPGPLPFPLQAVLHLEANARIEHAAGGRSNGSRARDLLTYPAGQAIGLVRSERSATNVFFDIVEEYVDTVGRLNAGLAAATEA